MATKKPRRTHGRFVPISAEQIAALRIRTLRTAPTALGDAVTRLVDKRNALPITADTARLDRLIARMDRRYRDVAQAYAALLPESAIGR